MAAIDEKAAGRDLSERPPLQKAKTKIFPIFYISLTTSSETIVEFSS